MKTAHTNPAMLLALALATQLDLAITARTQQDKVRQLLASLHANRSIKAHANEEGNTTRQTAGAETMIANITLHSPPIPWAQTISTPFGTLPYAFGTEVEYNTKIDGWITAKVEAGEVELNTNKDGWTTAKVEARNTAPGNVEKIKKILSPKGYMDCHAIVRRAASQICKDQMELKFDDEDLKSDKKLAEKKVLSMNVLLQSEDYKPLDEYMRKLLCGSDVSVAPTITDKDAFVARLSEITTVTLEHETHDVSSKDVRPKVAGGGETTRGCAKGVLTMDCHVNLCRDASDQPQKLQMEQTQENPGPPVTELDRIRKAYPEFWKNSDYCQNFWTITSERLAQRCHWSPNKQKCAGFNNLLNKNAREAKYVAFVAWVPDDAHCPSRDVVSDAIHIQTEKQADACVEFNEEQTTQEGQEKQDLPRQGVQCGLSTIKVAETIACAHGESGGRSSDEEESGEVIMK